MNAKEQMQNNYFKLNELLNLKENFILTTHINPDGDGLGSCIVMKRLLDKMGKKSVILIDGVVPDKLKFLPFADQIKTISDEDYSQFDTLIIIDTNSLDRIGKVANLIDNKTIKITACIDHHPLEDPISSITVNDITVSSTSCIIYDFLKNIGYEINKTDALCLYVGLVVDTGNFCQNNTDSRSMADAADYLKFELSPFKIYQRIYQDKRIEGQRLIGAMLSRINITDNKLCVYSYIEKQDIINLNANEQDTDDLINYIRENKDAEISVLFREISNTKTKINFRTKGKIDILPVAKYFNGGGHSAACGAMYSESLHTTIKKVISKINEYTKNREEPNN